MKRHLNTLFVTTQGAYLAKESETVLVRVEGETRLRMPILNLAGIVCFGNVRCSPFLMGLCAKRQVAISFLTERGRFLAAIRGPTSGNVLLRREQYRRSDDEARCLEIARPMIAAKVANSRSVIVRALREQNGLPNASALRQAAASLRASVHEIQQATSLDILRGLEGQAARSYFAIFDDLICHQKDDFTFQGRNRRPPLDRINALLSFLYTLLRHDISAALECVGLDPAVGFLHRDRPGRPGLALDLMEEFRPYIADRLALSLIHLKQIRGDGFKISESGGVSMDDETRKTVLVAYQKRKQDVITHPFLNEKTTIGLLFHVQALLLARFLRSDYDGYPPFITR